MKALVGIGAASLILGVVLLFVPVPNRERHGVKIGGADIGVETTENRKVSPIASAALIAVGAVMMLAGKTRR